ncbi:hypothetical protein [Streptomyces sp. ISL-11]|uniref:hypothetical protein n=1 Tax=Streptomyces sp. ISL-11 TaxID=2819174 RepID=UPI001BE8B91D|nr:hypothetical protein [Streptomyces sp. ISL-11]MBT2387779.1 hypothetical protein [Streptomyces sp. ISL-11]
MAMPELLGVSPVAPPSGPRYKARALGVCLMLASLAGMGFCLSRAVKAAGYVADKGTVTVGHCWTVHRSSTSTRHSHDETRCSGAFRPKGGRTVRTDAELKGFYVPGERVDVYREGSDYSLVSPRAGWGWLCAVFFGLITFTQGLVAVVIGFHARSVDEFRAAHGLIARSPFGGYVTRLLQVGGAGMLLCVLLACVSP